MDLKIYLLSLKEMYFSELFEVLCTLLWYPCSGIFTPPDSHTYDTSQQIKFYS